MQRFDAKTYLKIDIANSFGLDKKNWDERVAWFDQNQDHLKDLVAKAEDPAMFYAGVRAWEDVHQGKPIGYPVSLDATSSGLQLLAALTGDRSAAELCNVVDTGNREDAYTGVYQAMLARIGEGAKIKRDDTKRAIMTSLYGSTAVPKEVFGEGTLLQVFLETMQDLAPAAWELNEAFLEMWDPDALEYGWVMPDNFHVHCKVKAKVTETVHFLNEPIEVSYHTNRPTKEGRALGANAIHSIDGMIVRELTARCSYDPDWIELVKSILNQDVTMHFDNEKARTEAHRMVTTLWDHYVQSGYLSARILEYLDSDTVQLVDEAPIRELLDSLPKKPFQLLAIHDCFRCLPHYANDLREQYNLQLMLIAKSNLLQFLISQLMGRPITINKLDPNLWKDVMAANYALS